MDLKNAKKEFLEYVSNYDGTKPEVIRKRDHSLRTMAICTKIAENLNLSQEEIEIAALIGLLHDIGRFDQSKFYGTFSDLKSIDHGDYGVEVLFKNHLIRKFIDNNQYDDIIEKAIKNHNKFKIEDGLSEKQEMFAKIARDADKIDILYQGTYLTWSNQIEQIEIETIQEQDMLPFNEKRLINRAKELREVKPELRHLLVDLALIYDIYFPMSYKIIKESDYINKIMDRFVFKDLKTKELMEQIREKLNEFINGKQKEE